MYSYIEELVWAVDQERREEVRRMRPHAESRPKRSGWTLRSRLARTLVVAGISLDRTARELALERPATADC